MLIFMSIDVVQTQTPNAPDNIRLKLKWRLWYISMWISSIDMSFEFEYDTVKSRSRGHNEKILPTVYAGNILKNVFL
jgi:hypothetical protein